MKPLPLPLRVAAGLTLTAVERARELPAKIAGLPVTVASQALQLSMRVQQQVTELAIKGDEALASFRPVEETPEWATFDEDLDDDRYDMSGPVPFDRVDTDQLEADLDTGKLGSDWVDTDLTPNGHQPGPRHDAFTTEPDPWALEERALAEEAFDKGAREPEERQPSGPAGIANYEALSLPQLRARLRTFSIGQLEELLEHEKAHANRPSFVGMLTRRIATVRDNR